MLDVINYADTKTCMLRKLLQKFHMWVTNEACVYIFLSFRVMCGYVWNWWMYHWTSFIGSCTAKIGEFLRMFWERLLSMYVVIKYTPTFAVRQPQYC